MSDGRYTGPVCWVPEQGIDIPAPGGRVKHLDGGWHYSTHVVHDHELPHRKLHLNDDDPGDVFYEFARNGHKSWLDKHGPGNVKQVGG